MWRIGPPATDSAGFSHGHVCLAGGTVQNEGYKSPELPGQRHFPFVYSSRHMYLVSHLSQNFWDVKTMSIVKCAWILFHKTQHHNLKEKSVWNIASVKNIFLKNTSGSEENLILEEFLDWLLHNDFDTSLMKMKKNCSEVPKTHRNIVDRSKVPILPEPTNRQFCWDRLSTKVDW